MKRKLVRENMNTHLITIGWNEKMERAFNRMHVGKVRHLPVVNDTGEIVGMLSDRDVQRSMISQIERPAGSYLADEKIEFDDESKVRDYMSWPVRSIEQNNDLRLVAERMITDKVSSFLVCNEEKIVGIITTEDLVKVLIQLLSDPKIQKQWTLNHVLEGAFNDLRSVLA